MEEFADLHLHSRRSDGEWPPAKLVRQARKGRLAAMALTDHDDVRGVAEAMAAGRELGVEVLAGVELSAWNGTDLHVLGYGFDPEHPALAALLEAALASRRERARRMTERLAELGAPVSLERVFEIAGEGAVGRPHVARAVVEAGHVSGFREVFDRFLGDGKPACVEKRRVEPAEAIDVLHRAGGVAVAAHPGAYGGTELLEPLLDAGLDGVEVRHPLHGTSAMKTFEGWAVAHGLVRTGGSDFHGPRAGGPGVGTVSIPREWWDELLDRIERRRSAAAGPGGR